MGEFGWAAHGSQAGGVSGSVQTARPDLGLTGSTSLIYDHIQKFNPTVDVCVRYNLANQYNVNVVNETVTNISASGDTKFGDSVDDVHIFTGSLDLSSSINPLKIYGLQTGVGSGEESILALVNNNIVLTSSAGSGLIQEYTNAANNRIITSIDFDGINAEQNLTFDGSTLTVTGDLSSSVIFLQLDNTLN